MQNNRNVFVEQAYTANAERLVQYAFRETCDRDLAEDAVQEVFLQMAKNADYLMTHKSLVGWLIFALRYVLAKEAKKRTRRNEVPLEESIEFSYFVKYFDNDNLTEILPDGLSKEDRELLKMRFEFKFSHKDIAQQLGITEDASRKRLTRAFDNFADLYENIF
jgi:RNA polymerase sigma factor (sigma-70 family)